ncbi:MAG: ribosome assembly RNA-binding protein YhbY [Clostridiales bacterium]|jgi:RNA-binding protein|nr:ribosome assembly RNA-binding protein YhbY [Clostridiales bacterium]
MLTNKQRAYLKGLANGLNAAFQIGKAGVNPELVTAVSDYLEANELVKISVLNNCGEDVRDISEQIGGRSRSEVVQVIGKKIVLYRESKNKKKIEL